MRSPLAGAVALGTSLAAGLFAVGGTSPAAGTAPGFEPAVGTSSVGACGALPGATGCAGTDGPNIVGRPVARCQFSYSMNSETEKMIQRMVLRVSIETVESRE